MRFVLYTYTLNTTEISELCVFSLSQCCKLLQQPPDLVGAWGFTQPPLLYQHCPNDGSLLRPITVKLSSLLLQCAEGCPGSGTTSYVALLSKRSWWQRMSGLYLCNWRADIYPCVYTAFFVFWKKKTQPNIYAYNRSPVLQEMPGCVCIGQQ